MAHCGHVTHRGQIPSKKQEQVPGRWLRHDAKVTWKVVVCSLIVTTFAAVGVYTAFSALTNWWLGR